MNIKTVGIVALREIKINTRNYMVFILAGLILALNILITRYGFSYAGTDHAVDARAVVLSLIHLQMYIVPLLGLIISYDGIQIERERGSLDLLLAYPIGYFDMVLGKWIGFSAVFAVAYAIGLSVPMYMLNISLLGSVEIAQFFFMSLLLGVAFTAIGLFFSALIHDRTIIIAFCVVSWIIFVFVFDISIVALLVITEGQISESVIRGLFLLNPVELYRFAAILQLLPGEAREIFGLGTGLLQSKYCLLGLLGWLVLPLLVAAQTFLIHRRRLI